MKNFAALRFWGRAWAWLRARGILPAAAGLLLSDSLDAAAGERRELGSRTPQAGLARTREALAAAAGLPLSDSCDGAVSEKRELGSRTPERVALFALNCYKAYLSPLLAGNCRYEPTCSVYMHQAIERFGVARGVWLGTKRLLRCHPLARKFGYDPVPEKWEEMRSNSATPSDTHGVRS